MNDSMQVCVFPMIHIHTHQIHLYFPINTMAWQVSIAPNRIVIVRGSSDTPVLILSFEKNVRDDDDDDKFF